jgi:hypothetical protein
MKPSARLALSLAILTVSGASMLACGDDASGSPSNTSNGDGGATGPSVGSGTLVFKNSPIYSAYVPNREAQVPVTLKDASLRGMGAKFSSSDESIATVTDTPTGGLVTVKKAGTVSILVSLAGETGAAKLTITEFTEAQWMAGQARFSKSELAIKNPTGGAISALLLRDPANRDANGACNTCHTAQAKTLKIENTPTQIAGYSDDELITIFTKGAKPEGATQSSMVPSFAWGSFHTWDATDEEKQGLVAYLRTQAPKDNPAMIDYGIMPCTPGTMGPPFCDAEGNPISFAGPGGQDAGTGTDAGATDSGVASDAGVAADAAAP